MFKRNQIQKSLVVAGVTIASFAAFSQQNEITTASVQVQNAFVLTENTPLSFGTITARQVSADSVIVLNADGTDGSPTNSETGIRVLAPGSVATYTVTGAAPFTPLVVSTNDDTVDLTNSTAPPANPDFTLSDFEITDGTFTGNVDSGGTTIADTIATGGLTFSLGGTLTLAGNGSADAVLLTDGAYEGQFTVTVSY
jgi:hypothetical protein